LVYIEVPFVNFNTTIDLVKLWKFMLLLAEYVALKCFAYSVHLMMGHLSCDWSSSCRTVPRARGTESLAWKNLETDGVGLERLFLLGNSFSGIFLFLL